MLHILCVIFVPADISSNHAIHNYTCLGSREDFEFIQFDYTSYRREQNRPTEIGKYTNEHEYTVQRRLTEVLGTEEFTVNPY